MELKKEANIFNFRTPFYQKRKTDGTGFWAVFYINTGTPITVHP